MRADDFLLDRAAGVLRATARSRSQTDRDAMMVEA
jgi:hypothetical protein